MTTPTIEVVYQHLPGDMTGLYDHQQRVIIIDPRCDYATRRSTLAHEMVHATRGDVRCENEWLDVKQELAVERTAAQHLLPFHKLHSTVQWCHDTREMAEHLDVDHSMLITRIGTLTPEEYQTLRDTVAELERTA